MQASRDVKSHASQNHWIAEQILDRSGIPATHLRPTLFAEWLLYLRGAIKDENILALPFGDVRYAPITGEDQGRVIAAILNHPAEHAGKIYPLFGAKELSQVEIAGLLSKVLGRTITYVPMEIDAFDAVLEKMGFTPYFRQHMTHVAQNTRDGVFSGMNDLVEKLSGQKPMEMIDYIIKNKALFI
jgi:NAD(P)H dehydrogenase (quinone)